MNAHEEIVELIAQNRGIANYLDDHAQNPTATAKMLRSNIKWLEKIKKNICNMGYIGCSGNSCDSDSHK